MIEISPSEENEVVLAFLKAEIDSPRFGSNYKTILLNSGLSRREIIDHPDLRNKEQNHIRRELLKAVRGYKANNYLFAGFPSDISWRKVQIKPDEFDLLRYAKCQPWIRLSGDTRLVTHGAKNVDCIIVEGANQNIKQIADDFKKGKRYPELIAVEDHDGSLILVEGHTRATAYALANLNEDVTILLGSSPTMHLWSFY